MKKIYCDPPFDMFFITQRSFILREATPSVQDDINLHGFVREVVNNSLVDVTFIVLQHAEAQLGKYLSVSLTPPTKLASEEKKRKSRLFKDQVHHRR